MLRTTTTPNLFPQEIRREFCGIRHRFKRKDLKIHCVCVEGGVPQRNYSAKFPNYEAHSHKPPMGRVSSWHLCAQLLHRSEQPRITRRLRKAS